LNSRVLIVGAVVAASVALAGTSQVALAKPTTTTTSTTVVHVAAKNAIPDPVAVVTVGEDEDGDGAIDSVPPSSGSSATARPLPSPTVASAAPAVSANGWRCPVPGGKFTNDWGAARSGGRSHEGTDMLAPRGTPIYAPVDGTVRFDTSSRGGNSFYLDTPGGLQLFGAHLDSYGTSGKVDSGTIIGYVGDTGNARGTTHLHFEIHPTKRSKTNPYPILKQICS
jgi:peptidoglycan LD-endopeptidase LytH